MEVDIVAAVFILNLFSYAPFNGLSVSLFLSNDEVSAENNIFL